MSRRLSCLLLDINYNCFVLGVLLPLKDLGQIVCPFTACFMALTTQRNFWACPFMRVL